MGAISKRRDNPASDIEEDSDNQERSTTIRRDNPASDIEEDSDNQERSTTICARLRWKRSHNLTWALWRVEQ
ncbi:hypothetical protein LWI29_021241 [Acer saccharum]|uniref:Uncharacterized protein n=1 Tax=Acer saccharum TaxID=4024 RepID=A0AA39S2J7_ACESA|nr:hypothetical protein LWI29_021241 [Acer saccharum]